MKTVYIIITVAMLTGCGGGGPVSTLPIAPPTVTAAGYSNASLSGDYAGWSTWTASGSTTFELHSQGDGTCSVSESVNLFSGATAFDGPCTYSIGAQGSGTLIFANGQKYPVYLYNGGTNGLMPYGITLTKQ